MKRYPLFICLSLLLLLVVAGMPASATPTITSVSPSTSPNSGDIKVTISGTGFNADSTVWMTACDSKNIVYGTVTSWSSTSIKADFKFKGVTPTSYDVAVNSPFTDLLGNYNPKDVGVMRKGFVIYQGTGTTFTTTTTTGTTTIRTTRTTSSTYGQGKNSVYFETNPSGAEIFLNGDNIGTSTFTYYTERDGSFEVVVKMSGYEDYVDRVNILSGGQRTRFYAALIPLASITGTGNATATPSSSSSSAPVKTTSTTRKSSIKIPTPLGTDPPLTEESPADPALALGAAGIAIVLALHRRR